MQTLNDLYSRLDDIIITEFPGLYKVRCSAVFERGGIEGLCGVAVGALQCLDCEALQC